MSLYWSEITDAEIAAGRKPTSITFQKLMNNPRAVLYGHETVPPSKRVLAEGCSVFGAVGNALIIRPGFPATMGRITADEMRGSNVIGPGSNAAWQPVTVYAGVYTVLLQGAGGGGASTQINGAYGWLSPGGGAGGFVRAYVTIGVLETLEYSLAAGGAVDADAANSFLRAVNGKWRLDAAGGKKGVGSAYDVSGCGAGGSASISGFAKGQVMSGSAARNLFGGLSAMGLGGRGGDWNTAGEPAMLAIVRGVY